jgi:glutathione S-transferase
MERGYAALQVMENHLRTHDFFAAEQLTIADIALYAYTHVADKCDFDLTAFPSIRTWLRRIEQQPGFAGMDGRAAPSGNATAGIAAST